MAGTTPIYNLPTDVVADDLIETAHHNLLADTFDRTVGNLFKRLMAAGAYSGWELSNEGTISAGEGIVAGCYCSTTAAQAITSLTPGITNYIYGQAVATSPDRGAIAFVASPTLSTEPDVVLLGTLTLDGNGNVTDLDNAPPGVSRNVRHLEIGQCYGGTTVSAVAPDATVNVDIDHSADQIFLVPGMIEGQITNEDFIWEIVRAHNGGGFRVVATNTGTVSQDLIFNWIRYGFIA